MSAISATTCMHHNAQAGFVKAILNALVSITYYVTYCVFMHACVHTLNMYMYTCVPLNCIVYIRIYMAT